MKKNRTILCVELLKSFSEDELRHFEQFLHCEMFNEDEKLILIFETLSKELDMDFTNEAIQVKAYASVSRNEKAPKNLS